MSIILPEYQTTKINIIPPLHQTAKTLHETEKPTPYTPYLLKVSKPFFYFLFFFFFFYSYAQTSTVYGFGNTYTYGEKDSIREGDFAVTYLESNGRIYAKSFTGGAYIIGSNSTKKIKFPDSTQIPDAYFTSTALNGALYLFGSGYVYRLKKI